MAPLSTIARKRSRLVIILSSLSLVVIFTLYYLVITRLLYPFYLNDDISEFLLTLICFLISLIIVPFLIMFLMVGLEVRKRIAEEDRKHLNKPN